MPGWIWWVVGGVALLPILAFAVAGLQYWTRGTPIRTVRPVGGRGEAPAVGGGAFLRSIALHVETVLDPGHRIELFFRGDDLYPRLFDDLSRARHLIVWHVFWFRPGRLADRLADVLTDRAAAGVRVLFLHDWFGSRTVDDAYYRRLRASGVEVATFRKPSLKTLYKLQQRSHARTVVVDGRVAYTGGFAIADEWMGDGRSRDEWRDTSARFEGDAVAKLQAAFAADWVEPTGELVVGLETLGDGQNFRGAGGGARAPSGPDCHEDCRAGVFYSAPSLGGTEAERLLVLTLAGARRRIWITSGYFVPGEAVRRMLTDAASRGVDVRVLHPGENTDRRATWYAARRHYEELLRGGVRIYEYLPTMVHAKTLVADDDWASVGTSNVDNRSMALNDEVNLLIHDRGVTERLARAFRDDLEHAREIELDAFRRRGPAARAKEWLCSLLDPVL